MKFREATENDLPEIVNIFLHCWKMAYVDVLNEEVRNSMDETAARNLWCKSFSQPERKTYLFEEDSHPVAVFRTGPDTDDESKWHLFSLYVDPFFAGRGIGNAALEKLFDEAKLLGKREISLWVFTRNTPAKKLYINKGFLPSGRTRITESWGELEEEFVKVNI